MRDDHIGNPLVSVIIPAYNSEKYIGIALESVLAQTHENLQVLIVNDASTDGTAAVLDSYNDPRLEIVTLETNMHHVTARNIALERAKGEYVAFLDNDDVWLPTKLEKQLAVMKNDPSCGVCFTWGRIIDENGNAQSLEDPDVRWLHNAFHEENRSRREWLLKLLTQGNFMLNSSSLIRMEIVKKIGLQNLSLVQMHDYDYWVRILSCADGYMLCEELTQFRRVIDGNSVSTRNVVSDNQSRNEEIFICSHFFDYISDEAFLALFGDLMRCSDSKTPAEIACEKAFLLEMAYCAPEPACFCLQRLMSNKETADLLRRKYHYSPKDFYSSNSEKRYLDRGTLNLMNDERQNLRCEIEAQQKGIVRLQQRVQELTDANGTLTERLNCAEGEIQQLRDKENMLKNEIEAAHRSRTWRIGRLFTGGIRKLIPVGSKRALFCRLLWTAVRHPIKFLKSLSVRKFKKFFRLLLRGDASSLNVIVRSSINGEPAPSILEVEKPDIIPVDISREWKIEDFPILSVPQWEDPQVSIVIPVYNQFAYTYHCVQSILKNSGDITYEIIIANDCSTDLTTRIREIIPGVVCVTNEQNLRFLRNCNNAAKHAKGKYILFLNNDTQVQKDWLSPLVTLIESSEEIGMVGSKLIYPDGRLQEAGGILWRDGSAWNFGNRQNPALPQFNYVKQVDYISGAAIMLSRELWERIGGFDEHFAPAYCEDSDLAFTVRKLGYKVMYQPKSVVVHFEGVSNGTDTSSGQKKYQIENSKKFREKWKEELDRHPENGENVFQARDYSYGKKTLLMVDHYVPHFDKDAGSRTVFQYLKLFVDTGFNVKFIGDNFYQHEPYTTALQQMGIEVLYGPDCAQGWKQWVKDNAEHFDYVFLNRPHIAPKYLDFLRQNTKAKIMYYGHDLAFLRELREFEITGDVSFKDSAAEWQPKELDLMRKADMAYYPSYVEVDEVHSIDPEIQVKAIPAYLFEDVQWEGYDFDSRKDIMFIGGFGHRPNIDAVKWLANDILPELVKRLPDIRIHILGSNAPKEILSLASKNLIMEGFVTDEQLEQFYRQSRISLVPLRYGAGIKGKVVEAMRYGTPVVTTATGAEGIPNAENVMLVEDDAVALAQKLADLYQDPERLTAMSQGSISYIQENYSPKNAISVIGPEFDLS